METMPELINAPLDTKEKSESDFRCILNKIDMLEKKVVSLEQRLSLIEADDKPITLDVFQQLR